MSRNCGFTILSIKSYFLQYENFTVDCYFLQNNYILLRNKPNKASVESRIYKTLI